MTLYEIDSNIRQIIENGFVVDEETGEVKFLQEDLEKLQADKKQKIESIALIIKEKTNFAENINDEIKTLTERKKATEHKIDNLKGYLNLILNGEKFETPRCSISYRKSASVTVENIELLPEEYIRLEVKKSADKAKIKKALAEGTKIAGCSVAESNNIHIK